MSSRIFAKFFYRYLIIFLLWPGLGKATNTSTMITTIPTTKESFEQSTYLINNLLDLLKQCEQSEHLTVDTVFGSLMAEFLIKEYVRYFEPTRYEEQLFSEILKHLKNVIMRARSDEVLRANLSEEQRTVLEHVFQRNIRIFASRLKHGHIDTHIEFRSLLADYENLILMDFPSTKQSDFCLASIVANQICDINKACLDVTTSDLPKFGYQRTQQILLLYVFVHHKCARFFGSQAAFEMIARRSCTQVYREQKVMRTLNITAAHRDLYLEQAVVCGVLGFAEFLNWSTINFMFSWPRSGACFCQAIDDTANNNSHNNNNNNNNNCECTNHISSLALIYLTNAILLLT